MIKLLARYGLNSAQRSQRNPSGSYYYSRRPSKKVLNWSLCTGSSSLEFFPYYKKLRSWFPKWIRYCHGCSTHQTSDWIPKLIKRTLANLTFEYLNDLLKRKKVQLTFFDEEHYCSGGNQILLLFMMQINLSLLIWLEISLEEATSGIS